MLTENTIATLGFPICVVIYLLYERYKRDCVMQKTLVMLNKNIAELNVLIKNNNLAAFVVDLKYDVSIVQEGITKLNERCKK